jgi:putative hemolysin
MIELQAVLYALVRGVGMKVSVGDRLVVRERIRRRLTAQVLSCGLGAVLWAACAADDEPGPTSEQPASTVALANPASVYCEDQGGEVEIVDEDDGQVGYCVLPDGTRVDEWEYFRANASTTQP